MHSLSIAPCAGRRPAFFLEERPRVRNTFLHHKLEIPSIQGVRNRRYVLTRGCSAAHCVVMNSCFGRQKRSPFWELVLASFALRARELGCALACNEFLFWAPKTVTILGTCFGTYCAHKLFSNNNERGHHFWSTFWEPLLVTFWGTHFVLVCYKVWRIWECRRAHFDTPP